mmetsp:Transcript_15070/g.24029  ORF Transcript_15070/g.24029 Transcript_15070/m.24029 type:complete len:246 (-) Transcript_15070:439-1176(-)
MGPKNKDIIAEKPKKPRKRRRKIEIDPSTLPRVNLDYSAAALKEECRARGVKGFSSCSKEDLVDMLGVNTIMMSGTMAYKTLQRIKEVMDDEDPEKRAEKLKKLEIKRQRGERQQQEKQRHNDEQKLLHTKSIPAIHACKLAPTNQLTTFRGVNRVEIATCSNLCPECESSPTIWSCSSCDFDACARCVNWFALPVDEQNARKQQYEMKKREQEEREDRDGRNNPFQARRRREETNEYGGEPLLW